MWLNMNEEKVLIMTKQEEIKFIVKRAANFPNPVVEMPVKNNWVKLGATAKIYTQENENNFRVIYEFEKM
jgi:hypothetical protein